MRGGAALVLALVMATAGAHAETVAPSAVHVAATDAGAYFRAADGTPLYWSADDIVAKRPTCVAACTEAWKPVLATPDETPPPGWTKMPRSDGGVQWAFQGRPLYAATNAAFGDKFNAVANAKWHEAFEPAELPAGFTMQTTLLGRVLADHKGRTLYAGHERDPADPAWLPLEAPWLAQVSGEWSLVPLPSGGRQWAFKGRPLYRYDRDKDPQDLHGHGLPGGWSAVVLEPPPALPRWMTIQRADLGWVYADAKGMTVYAPARPETIKVAQTCPEDCMRTYWRPVLAADDERSSGPWAIVTNEAGQRQWSYEGRPLYTHTRDTKPGEMRGNSFAVGYNIGDGFRVILIDAALPPPGS